VCEEWLHIGKFRLLLFPADGLHRTKNIAAFAYHITAEQHFASFFVVTLFVRVKNHYYNKYIFFIFAYESRKRPKM
jgi:hypothetical protein